MPPDLRAEMSRSASLANPVWVAARRDNDFASFLPVLRKNLDLRKRYIDCFEVGDEPYDIVLDDYERGMKTAEVRRIFDYLKEHQAPLVKEVAERAQVEKREKTFDIDAQKIFELEVVREFGFTADAWRLDPTVHPFASGTGVTDIRITTRYFTDGLEGLFGTMHEFGHGLYEHQVDPTLERSPLARGVSLGMHESQSRMWENLVGRSQPFWRRFFPRAAGALPRRARRARRRELVPRGERRRAVADPRRGRRGDLQPAHHPALRARAGDARGRVPARAAARGVEPAHVGVPRHRGAERHRAASCRTCTGRAARSATSRRTRSAT